MKQSVIQGKWRWLLAGSIALNLLVIGMIAGAGWRHAAQGERRAYGGGGAMTGPYLRALPDTARQEFRTAARSGEDANRQQRRARRVAGYKAVADALRTEPFDRALVLAVLKTQRQTTLARQEQLRDVWLGIVGDMDAQTRAAYADAMMEQAERRGRRKRRKQE